MDSRMSQIPLNGPRLTSRLHRLLSTGSGGDRTGYRVAQEMPDDSTLEYLDERPANIVARVLRESS